MSKTAYKTRHMESSSIATRYLSLCQQNRHHSIRHHSMSSLTKFVLSALEDLVSISFLNVWQHFTCDDLDFHALYGNISWGTYIIIFGVPPKSLWSHVAYQQYHVFIFLPNWMQLLMWCQGHLNGGETWQQGDWNFRLQNTSNVRTSTVLKITQLPHLVV